MFKKLQDVYIARATPNTPYVIGEMVTINSVVNVGTRTKPVWRYHVAGAFFDADQLSPIPTL